jgi:cell wall assembly regulator SMI1
MRVLRDQLRELRHHFAKRDFDVRTLIFERPATPSEVDELESKMEACLPPSFREVLVSVSKHVEFRWFIPEGIEFPAPFASNFSGDLHWSLDVTAQCNEEKASWVRKLFPHPEDPYDAVWHNKLAFYKVGNGDFLAMDLSGPRYEQIVYLSHDDGQGHGYVLADNFSDLLRRWVPLACTGGEDWQWLPFTSGPCSRLDPVCENAFAWRKLLGLAT